MCIPLGLALCPKGPMSSKPSWCSRGSKVMHLRCCVALFSFSHSHGTACQAAPAAPLLSRQQRIHCHWIHIDVIGFTALLPVLALRSSLELPLPNVTVEVSASTEAGQPPLSTTSGNPSSIRMLNLWPLSNLVHPPLPTIHYRCLHSCRCVLLYHTQSFQVPTGVLFLDPYNFPLCLCWNREHWKSFMEEAYKIWTSVCYET